MELFMTPGSVLGVLIVASSVALAVAGLGTGADINKRMN